MNYSFFNPVAISLLDSGSWANKILNLVNKGEPVLFIYSYSALKGVDKDGSFLKEISSFNNVKTLTKVESNPSIKQFAKIRADLGKFSGTIVALGGGSVIDFSKVLIAFNNGKDNLTEKEILDMVVNKGYLNFPKGKINLIALPTTSGTGSEMTKWATIWDMENKKKYSVEDNHLYPKEAWIDPELTLNLSRSVTISTALDAMCQATEAYWSSNSNTLVRRLSANSIKEIITNIYSLTDNLDDINLREKVALGSVFSAISFSQTRTTASHALSYPLTARFGIPHGTAVALTIVEVLKINWPFVKEKELFLEAFGVDKLDQIIIKLNKLLEDFVYPEIKNIDTTKLDQIINEDISSMGARLGNNPTPISKEQIIEIYKKVLIK